ncbi:flagellar protein export ATPase FliI [Wenzhouxiangella sp. AB-CW3]|uniref:flagellar protein export ATPase FliI n=1 Tax=Wenzhouxiangella sp. AB-CW3 TaxID=2771012 RepID=UPI00168AAE6B|nr:flagellar protein export ATPase FliI [Wenzhouxiangella sp. AB-CW3]QOC21201.1 flagellar protein export ATPase FliI [Wenzhouxiangella sp. AB-CW3]
MSSARAKRWADSLRQRRSLAAAGGSVKAYGRLRRVVGLTLEAVGVEAALGERCWVVDQHDRRIEAEVVGFAEDSVYLMPTEEIRGLSPNARVMPGGGVLDAPAGRALLGRVIDGAGEPLDGRGPLRAESRTRLQGDTINPLERTPIREPLDVGVRAINSLFTVGRGQRLGLFAGSGVGKSTLLGMMTRFTEADVIVVGLIGERGREVADFVESTLGKEGMRRAVVVASPADRAPLMRMRGAWLATAIAEHFRDQGLKVLLLMDSLTRFAQAKREVALAVGEPPATKGYPPSVFTSLPTLVERAGNSVRGGGSITAFYTVLVEGDDSADPIADASRAILDGHIVLSRQMAESGVYPAIDVEASISRSMMDITSESHQAKVRRFRQIHATYRQNEDLIAVGAYRQGNDPRIDEAVAYRPKLLDFLRQTREEAVPLANSFEQLEALLGSEAESGQSGT